MRRPVRRSILEQTIAPIKSPILVNLFEAYPLLPDLEAVVTVMVFYEGVGAKTKKPGNRTHSDSEPLTRN